MLKRECKTQIQNSKCTLQCSIASQFNSLASHAVTSVHEYKGVIRGLCNDIT